MNTKLILYAGLSLLIASAPAAAGRASDAVWGGLIGGAAGAAIGYHVDGESGAAVGAAVGGATGVLVASSHDSPRRVERPRKTIIRPEAPVYYVYPAPHPVRVYERPYWRRDRGWHRGHSHHHYRHHPGHGHHKHHWRKHHDRDDD